ncbi:MAG: HAD family phosphatase [Kineosporiaceae bacterium]|nr:HAD family phosphatase [Kineosporiaceae bacterium]MBK7622179.1 HAD family phosphatase [Kineosporiaceae bacterium]
MSPSGPASTAFAFDLDGTLTCEELLPVIAEELSLSREMATLTRLTLDGTIDFEDSFRLRCAILRAVPISRVRDIVAEVALTEALADFISAHAEDCYVVTGNLDVWIRPILDRLGCRAFTSVGRAEGDQLLGVDTVLRKSTAVAELNTRYDRVVAVGDSVNDISMFELADIGIAYGGVHDPADDLIEVADYATYREEALCRLLNTLS